MLMLTGTLFVLMKDPSPKQQLLELVSSSRTSNDDEVQQLIEKLQTHSPERRPAASAKTQGKWRLLWSKQVAKQTLGISMDEASGSCSRHTLHSTRGAQYWWPTLHEVRIMWEVSSTSHHLLLMCIMSLVLSLPMCTQVQAGLLSMKGTHL